MCKCSQCALTTSDKSKCLSTTRATKQNTNDNTTKLPTSGLCDTKICGEYAFVGVKS